MSNNRLTLLLCRSTATLVLAWSLSGTQAFAQDQTPAAAPEDSATVGEVIVTGSRLGRNGYDAPTPVNVVGQERMNQLAITNVGDALNQIPSFRPITSPSTNNFRVSANIGARNLDLRGLGATRTLTLIDGRRFVGSSDNGAVDLNSIPSILVQRSEVVTGGASAAYGANAVAGVVNLILDTKFTGFKFEASTGVTKQGDGKNYYAAGAYGGGFSDGRGHFIIGAEYAEENGVGQCEQRDWCAKYTNYISNPGYNTTTRTSTNGLPATLVLDNVMFVYNENGILTGATKPNGTGGTTTLGQQVLNVGATSLPAVLRGKQFDASGNLVPYQFGQMLSGLFQVGRDGTQPYLLGQAPALLVVPTKHFSGMFHADYDVTDSITASGEFIYARAKGYTQSTVPLDGPATIDINNPYISAASRATILAADPAITKLLVNHGAWALGASTRATSTLNTYRGAFALKGDIGEGWSWDAYYTYGKVDSDVQDKRVRLKEWNNAVDAVVAPAGLAGIAAGSIICRTTLTNPTNGCIPINLFGYGQISPAADARYNVTETQSRHYKQQALAANLRGAPFSTWAGEVKFAAGAEWRRDTAVGGVDANTLAGNYIAPATTPLPFTKTTVTEGYLEVGVPLLKDSPLGEALDIDGAVRRTHYNPFGNATTWKIGGVYTPISDITFRVTRSRDIRAPTAQESSPNATTTNLPQPDPFVGGTTLQLTLTGGNPNLELEKGDTFTAGVVLRPSFIPRFNLSVDYYDIKVRGAIDTLSSTAIANACKQQSLLCNLIQFNANGSINTVFSTFQNLSRLHAEGYELVTDYNLPALGGTLAFQLNGSYVVDLSTIGGTGLVSQLDDVTGNTGTVQNIQGVPRWRGDLTVTYSQAKWSVTAHGRYIPKSILDPTKIAPGDAGYDVNNPNSVNINHVDARFYLDLSARYKFGEDDRYEVFGSINNVFDKGEPKQLRLFGNGLYYDPFGQAYKMGLRARF
jgi:outer membrane receptor protein involved in Fe transport